MKQYNPAIKAVAEADQHVARLGEQLENAPRGQQDEIAKKLKTVLRIRRLMERSAKLPQ